VRRAWGRASSARDYLYGCVPSVGSWSPMTLRLPVVSLTAHALMITLVLLAALGYVIPMPLHAVVAPLPPAAPDPPPQVTDARVFPTALTLYSSLPLVPAQGRRASSLPY
jgi:hypothetical protein